MSSPSLRIPAALIAAALAGPLFMFSYAAAAIYLEMPQPVTIEPAEAIQFTAMLLPAVLIGGVVGFVPIALGTLVMSGLADHWEAARSPLAWSAAGAVCGTGLALAFGAWPEAPEAAFALVATSTVCARICRAGTI